MFQTARSFNQPLNNWNVSKVTNMEGMFDGCDNFNIDLSDWDVSKVTHMKNMFKGCKRLNDGYKPGELNGDFFDDDVHLSDAGAAIMANAFHRHLYNLPRIKN